MSPNQNRQSPTSTFLAIFVWTQWQVQSTSDDSRTRLDELQVSLKIVCISYFPTMNHDINVFSDNNVLIFFINLIKIRCLLPIVFIIFGDTLTSNNIP